MPIVQGRENLSAVYKESVGVELAGLDPQAFGFSYDTKQILVLPTLQPRGDFARSIIQRQVGRKNLYYFGRLAVFNNGNIRLSDIGLDGSLDTLEQNIQSGNTWKQVRKWFTLNEGKPSREKEYALIMPNFAFTFGPDPQPVSNYAALFLTFSSKNVRNSHVAPGIRGYRIA